ncbi:type VI-C CRISPR-associated RNA-guided ribonuclease Cas13c [Fusobacterium sp.]|uniref:type VI-C CRISPR-associated RNA-guided ribonuclease Cas13c n=1 Tax=Fusobacterium sp. TaxID=68766 RepID=UPI0026343CB2|nr:type VI-C CRISPR-associated RNA-guided ribonuclease Cas13c [Fusobacterium sp.]
MVKQKSNRSSIIKIIISNYDSKGIKEIKVRYNKQTQLDTFIIESQFENGIFTLKDIRWKAREKYKYNIIIKKVENNSAEIIKEDKSLNKIIRKYKISFVVSSKNQNIVVVRIEDLMPLKEEVEGERTNTRRLFSETERKLLSEDTQLAYSKIGKCSPEEIDSIKIYKIKRYLNYRSNMLIFFSLINDFLCEGLKGLVDKDKNEITEIWRVLKEENKDILEDVKEKITLNFEKNLSKELEYYKNKIEKNIKKNENTIDDCEKKINKEKRNLNNNKLRKKSEKEIKNQERKIEECRKNLEFYSEEIKKVDFLKKEDLKSDIEKILKIYAELRHKLAHYDYKYFEELFENNNQDIELAELLDLNIFRYLILSKKLRIENKTNYLEDNTKITLLGVNGVAKKYYSLYNTLCEQKNGFNNFINSFFVEDGVENSDFKKLINEKFENDIQILNNKKIEFEKNQDENRKFSQDKELEFLKEQKEKLDTAYIWDIHNLKEYKKEYLTRKEKIEEYNMLLAGSMDRTALRNKGKDLVDLKKRMEELTKRNSIIRLKYKLQVAYAFLMIEFNGDVHKFKNEFDIAKIEEIKKFQTKGKEYLNYSSKDFNINQMKEGIEKLENSFENDWLNKDIKNNLFKFYVLTYILLPFEFKGDFLGFVKKHYYDIKNIEFLDESSDELTNKQLEKIKNDSFFSKIRLFEKNAKKYNVFSKSILEEKRVKEYFEKLNIEAKYYEYTGSNGEERGIFNKNIVIPIFKYYQIVLKLYNDVEIAILLYLSREKNISIEEVMAKAIGEKYYNLTELFKQFVLLSKEKINLKGSTNIRNAISHLDYKEFIEGLINYDPNNNFNINVNLGSLFKFINKYSEELNSVNLDFNFVNDYYMKKEQFIFGQLKQTNFVITNSIEEKSYKQDGYLLKVCKLKNTRYIEDTNKIYEKYEILKKISQDENIKEKSDIKEEKVDLSSILNKKKLNIESIKKEIEKLASDVLGLYKKQTIKLLKRKIVNKIKYGEEKLIYITSYNAETKEKKLLPLIKVMRIQTKDEFKFFDAKQKQEHKQKVISLGENSELKLIIGSDKDKQNNLEKFEIKICVTSLDEEYKKSNKDIIDLREHYCFNVEIKFKDKNLN